MRRVKVMLIQWNSGQTQARLECPLSVKSGHHRAIPRWPISKWNSIAEPNLPCTTTAMSDRQSFALHKHLLWLSA
jgi:hypothetical protein